MDGGLSFERSLHPDHGGARRRLSLSGAVTAAPDLVLGLLYFTLWRFPGVLPDTLAASLPRAIPIEFVVIHASGFLAWPWVARWTDVGKRLRVVALMAGGYTLALGIASLAVGGMWPLLIFWSLMLNRMLVVMLGDLPDDRAITEWGMAWAGTTALFVGAVALSIFAAPDFARQAVVIGFLYFTLVGLSELTAWAWVHRWMQAARRRAGSARRR